MRVSLIRMSVAVCLVSVAPAGSVEAKPAKPSMSVSVIDYGARGNGVTDDTSAFQKALDAVGKDGGGVIAVPTGRYMIKGHLYFPERVTLEGVGKSPTSDMTFKGASVLLAVEGEGDEKGRPFIFLHANCVLKGITIYYPNQGKNGLKPYPWTVMGDGDGVTIIDVFMVNPWQAVDFGSHPCGRHLIRGLNAGALHKGIFIDACYDVGRIENVHLYPFMGWQGEVREYMSSKATAFIIGKTDWQYITNCFSFGYRTGFHFIKGFKDRTGNVTLTQSGADDGKTCVRVDACQPHSGIAFSNCQMMGTVEIAATNNGPVKFSNCGFWPVGQTDNHAYLEGHATVTFIGCHFLDWGRKDPNAPCIVAKGGSLIVNGCDFMSDKPHIRLEENVASAAVVANRLRGGLKIENNSKGDVEIGLNITE